ncbi:ABC transporter substrate-binding protein [Halomonas sp. BC04]|uniref:ABC transporter substrate-binding protein n=1 Tax=Halomonas sp. BC04 TaxID=1403540 RepID=UPI0004B62A13|nr:ABC transporter substrate-binding protein [Halomonas sp. BC04]
MFKRKFPIQMNRSIPSSPSQLLGKTVTALALAGLMTAPVLADDDKISITYVMHEAIDIFGDPIRGSTYDEHRAHLAQFEPLVYDFDGRTGESGIQPGLAVDWEQTDDLTWRFHLREGVTFHNGEPFNAHAVKFSIDRVFDEDYPGADKFLDVPITEVEVIDEFIVDIHTSEPVPIMLQRLSRNGAFILEPNHYENLSYEDALTSPMGTGPYRLVDYATDEHYTFEAYEDYWGWDENSNIDELRILMIPEISTSVAELLTGNVDIVRLTADLVGPVESEENTEVIVAPSVVRAVVMFNLTVDECLEDARVRQALNYAVDRGAMIDAFAFGNRDLAMKTMVNPPNDHPGLEPYPFDPDKARELLAEANCSNFEIPEIDVMQPQAMEHAEATAQYWRMVGVDVGSVSLVDPAIMRERWMDRSLGVHAYTWSAAENTPETDMYAISDSRQRNSTHWDRPEFEEMYQELQRTVDQDRRDELNYALQEMQYNDPPGTFLYLRPIVMGVSKRLEGYYPHPSMLMEDWKAIYVNEE